MNRATRPGSQGLVRNLWNSHMGGTMGFNQLPAQDVNRLTAENDGAQTVAFHTSGELLKSAAASTSILYSIRASHGIPMSVSSKLLDSAGWLLITIDAGIDYFKEGKEILDCQAGN